MADFAKSLREVVITSVLDSRGPTMFSGRGVRQDTIFLMNHMDKIYWS